MRERVYERQCVTRWQVTAKSRGINWKVVHRGSNAFGKHSARSCRVGTRASIVPLSFFSTRLYTRFYTRIRIYVRFRVYILKEPLHARISFELILRILLFSMSSSTFYVTNSFCNLLLWKRFGCCYNRCMIFWLGNSEQIVRGIVSQYRQIVAIPSINENFS